MNVDKNCIKYYYIQVLMQCNVFMLKIRLTRRGKKNKSFFRMVVAEHTAPIKGKFIEVLGFLNPHTKEKKLREDRIKYWIEKGAQCSDTVHNLLVANGVIKGPKRAIKLKKKAVSAEAAAKPEDGKTEEKPEPASLAGKEKKEDKKAETAKPESEKRRLKRKKIKHKKN